MRSASCSVARMRARFAASSSSSELSPASSASRLRRCSSRCSSILWALGFLLAAAIASALALASAALFAFSRSTSESSSSSQLSATCFGVRRGQRRIVMCVDGRLIRLLHLQTSSEAQQRLGLEPRRTLPPRRFHPRLPLCQRLSAPSSPKRSLTQEGTETHPTLQVVSTVAPC